MKTEAGPQNGKVYTEEDWNTESKPDKAGGYRYSKVSTHAHRSQPPLHKHAWNTTSTLRRCVFARSRTFGKTFLRYTPIAQIEAEKAGWEFSKKEGISLVTINPTFVLGPVVGKRADAQSIMDFKVRPHILRTEAAAALPFNSLVSQVQAMH